MTPAQTALTLTLAAGGYFLGAVPFALIVAKRLYGVDIREHGSGNAGAGNVFHVLGLRGAALVMTFDMAKGFLPALAAVLLLPPWPAALVAFMPVIGHQYSVFSRGGGGKGIATAAGAMLPLSLVIFLVTLIPWIVTVSIRPIRKAGALVAGGLLLVSSLVVDVPSAYRVVAVAMCLSVLVKFRSEIVRRLRTPAAPEA